MQRDFQNPDAVLHFALRHPIIYDFAYDDDGVDDNNGVIEGYGVGSVQDNLQNIGANVGHLSSKTMTYAGNALRILLKLCLKILNYNLILT